MASEFLSHMRRTTVVTSFSHCILKCNRSSKSQLVLTCYLHHIVGLQNYIVDESRECESPETEILCSKLCSAHQHEHDIINYMKKSKFSMQEIQWCLRVKGFHYAITCVYRSSTLGQKFIFTSIYLILNDMRERQTCVCIIAMPFESVQSSERYISSKSQKYACT